MYRKLYDENKNFREYVDRYSKKYVEGKSISIEEALTHLIVKNVGDYYISIKYKEEHND
ncbi:MAG: hypothetical protein J6U54_01730 [Clostridiales bacterium]|nr:hypothetical protein [Clostridiales bacterium]